MEQHIGMPNRKRTALIVIDAQERLMPVIHNKEDVFKNINILIAGTQILGLPTLVTEQYTKGLGPTCEDIRLPENARRFEKMCFSCLEQSELRTHLNKHQIGDLILCGVEAHICVLKTALEAAEEGFRVHVVADAISSRKPDNKLFAIERMKQSGIFITTAEMILFMLMDEAGNEEFKAISKLIK